MNSKRPAFGPRLGLQPARSTHDTGVAQPAVAWPARACCCIFNDEAITQCTDVERWTCRARSLRWKCTDEVGRCVTAELTGSAVLGGGVRRCGVLRWQGGVPAASGGQIGPILWIIREGGIADRRGNGEPWEAPVATQISSRKGGSPVSGVEHMRLAKYRALLARWSGARRSRMEGKGSEGGADGFLHWNQEEKRKGRMGGSDAQQWPARGGGEQRAHVAGPAVATQREIEAREANRWAPIASEGKRERGKGRWAWDQNQIKFELFQTHSNLTRSK
jgi:hypothetical protein